MSKKVSDIFFPIHYYYGFVIWIRFPTSGEDNMYIHLKTDFTQLILYTFI